MKHGSHADIIVRLRRADGHLRALIAMIEAGRSCTEVAQQLHAVERAVGSAKREFIHDHIDHCLAGGADESGHNSRQAIAELKELTKYL